MRPVPEVACCGGGTRTAGRGLTRLSQPPQDEQSLEKIMAIVSERVPVRSSAATSADKFINGLGGGGGGGSSRDGPSGRDSGRRSRDTGGYDAEERKVGRASPPTGGGGLALSLSAAPRPEHAAAWACMLCICALQTALDRLSAGGQAMCESHCVFVIGFSFGGS